jgi:seryl-tRNA synthetase
MRLYELTQTYQEISDLDLDQDSLEAVLESLTDTVQEKADNIGKLITQLEAESVAYKHEMDRLANKKKQNDTKIEGIKTYLDFNLKAMNIQKLETPLFKFSYRKSESVVIDDLEAIADEYKRVKTVVDADKTSIKSALKNGLQVTGAHIEEKQNLQIK